MTLSEPDLTATPPGDRHITRAPRRLHASAPVLDVLPYVQQMVFPALVLAVSIGIWGLVVALLLAALLVLWRILAWSRYSYRIESGMLRIEEGVLRRSIREIPLTRIQQVDLRRQLRHRVLGVVAVRIDTAGGGSGAEAVLNAVSNEDALELRSALLLHRPGEVEPGPPATQRSPDGHPRPVVAPDVVAQIGTRDLALAGVTGSGLLAGLSVVGFAFLALEYLPRDASEAVSEGAAGLVSSVFVLAAILAVVVPLWLAIAAGTSVVQNYGFTLVRYGNDLHLRRGLLDEREATLALHRVQAVWVNENPVRRMLGLVSVQMQSAGSGTSAEGEVSRLTVPLLRRADLPRLLELVAPGSTAVTELVPAPPAARRRSLLRAGVAVLLSTLIVGILTGSPFAGLTLVALIPALWLGDASYRALGHALTTSTVVSRSGALLRNTALVPIAKSQSCRIVSTPFQRRVGLATLRLQVAGRGPAVQIYDGDATTLRTVRLGALGAPATRRDEAAVRKRTHTGSEAAETLP